MARESLSTERIVKDGLVATYTAAVADGHQVPWSERMFIHVKNDDTASKTITAQTPGQVSGLDIAEHTVDVAAGDEAFIGPFLAESTFKQSDGDVYIDYSATTSVTVAALII